MNYIFVSIKFKMLELEKHIIPFYSQRYFRI